MKISSEEKSNLASKLARERVKDGTHHFLGEKNPRYDNKVYCFENKISKEIVNKTQREMIITYNIDHANLSKVIKGKRKSVNG